MFACRSAAIKGEGGLSRGADIDSASTGVSQKLFKASAGFDLAHVEFHVVRRTDVSSDFREISVKMPSAGIADGGDAAFEILR